jgi:hypothetical protein
MSIALLNTSVNNNLTHTQNTTAPVATEARGFALYVGIDEATAAAVSYTHLRARETG